MRARLPWWQRWRAVHPVARDHLDRLVRYRPFREIDLDRDAKGSLADTLSTGRIFIPNASTFNDPWEAAPALLRDPFGGDLINQLADFLAFLAPGANTPANRTALLQHLGSFDLTAVTEEAQRLLMEALRPTPIICLSESRKNFLMWSYYGKGHNGWALVFDTRFQPFAGAVRVVYARSHPRILLTARNFNGYAVAVLATKARQWRHEREWRVIVPQHDPGKVNVRDFAIASASGYYGYIPRESIVGVIVGDQLFKSPNKARFLDMLSDVAPHVPVSVAEIDRQAFRINLRSLDTRP